MNAYDVRRKERPSKEYFKSGALRSIYFDEITEVLTPMGALPAELLTYYEDGSINRLFPLYGMITAYWTEDDEFTLSKEITITTGVYTFSCHALDIHFYPSGAVQSVTIWPQAPLKFRTPLGVVETRKGVEFYEDGTLKSIEPVFGSRIQTPNGEIRPFPINSLKLHAEGNTLQFQPDGEFQLKKLYS